MQSGVSQPRLAVLTLAAVVLLPGCEPKERPSMNHVVVLDGTGRILSWATPQEAAYDEVSRRATTWLLERSPVAPNGLPVYYSYSTLSADGRRALQWPHNPAGLYAMMVEYALAWYAYSGDRRLAEVVTGLLDHQLAFGTTGPDDAWALVPYSSGEPGSLVYAGASPGAAPGVIETDKVGELGSGYLRWYLFTGDPTYREAALRCAEALAANVRTGDADHSPWPFRVRARDGAVVEEYTSAVIGAIRLLDELVRLGIGDVTRWQAVRDQAWGWLVAYPLQNGRWSGYFEDIPAQAFTNANQYAPMELARYLLDHPQADPDWATHVPGLITWVQTTLSDVEVPDQPGVQWGAHVVSEQLADLDRMGSHTSRWAEVNARWAEVSGDAAARERAFYSFNWASYMCREDGVVNTGPLDAHVWFTDGYADYVRHFLGGMAAVPAWAPPGQSHLLRSTGVVTQAAYAPGEVSYALAAADGDGDEVLRLAFTLGEVRADGVAVDPLAAPPTTSYAWDAAGGVLRIHRAGARQVRVLAGP